MVGRRRRPERERGDPFAVLGLGAGASADEVAAARRRLAKAVHPDAGGSAAAMQRLNAAADAALAEVAARQGGVAPSAAGRRSGTGGARSPRERDVAGRYDHPSFTVEALPVETFEALLVAAAALGQLIDDEPPYALEVALAEPVRGWCRLEVVPDAGASTVSLAVGAEPGWPAPDLHEVRDHWINALNGLDWSRLQP